MRGITLKKRSVVIIFAAAAAIIAGTTISGCSLSEQTYRVPVYSADSDGSVGLITYTANGNDIVVTDYTLAQIGIVVPDEIDGKRVAEIADSAVSISDATASVVIMRDSDEKTTTIYVPDIMLYKIISTTLMFVFSMRNTHMMRKKMESLL